MCCPKSAFSDPSQKLETDANYVTTESNSRNINPILGHLALDDKFDDIRGFLEDKSQM
jgi:hypothetical protein